MSFLELFVAVVPAGVEPYPFTLNIVELKELWRKYRKDRGLS